MQGEVAWQGVLEPKLGEEDLLKEGWPRVRVRAWMGQQGVHAAERAV